MNEVKKFNDFINEMLSPFNSGNSFSLCVVISGCPHGQKIMFSNDEDYKQYNNLIECLYSKTNKGINYYKNKCGSKMLYTIKCPSIETQGREGGYFGVSIIDIKSSLNEMWVKEILPKMFALIAHNYIDDNYKWKTNEIDRKDVIKLENYILDEYKLYNLIVNKFKIKID